MYPNRDGNDVRYYVDLDDRVAAEVVKRLTEEGSKPTPNDMPRITQPARDLQKR